MSEQFLAEIRAFPFNWAPRGWAQCNGQIMPIAQNQALFSILGVSFGGDGMNTFALPDLRGRAAIGVGPGPNLSPVVLGEVNGEAAHQLSVAEMPSHIHIANASSTEPTQVAPTGNVWAASNSFMPYNTASNGSLNAAAIAPAGGGQGHSNMQPYGVANFCIATEGIFPSRN